MPNNQGTRTNPRLDLGEAVMELMDSADAFIATKALPQFKTQLKASSFTAITRESIGRDADLKRAPRGEYNRDAYDVEDKTFNCEEYGNEQPIDDGERKLYANDFDADLSAVKIATRKVLVAQERRANDLIMNTTTFTGASLYTDVSGAPWDTAGSDVIGQIIAAKTLVRNNCGMKPNALIMGYTNLERLLLNTAIRAAISPTQLPTVSAIIQALAGLLDLPYILVGGATRNSANEGIAFVGADIWNEDYAMVARIVENAEDLKEPGLGRSFLWTADSPENTTVEEYREEKIRSDVFRVRQHSDEMLLDPNFGHLLKVD